MTSRPCISVVLPTFNEVDNLPRVLEQLREALAGFTHEVIVVDDNSPDGTWRLAQELSGRWPWLRVIRRIGERGLGAAIIVGFASGRGEYLAVMDADMQHDASALPRMIKALDAGADIAVGTRYGHGGGLGDWSWPRRLISLLATRLAQWILPNSVSDPLSGFFMLRRDFFDEVSPWLSQRGFKLLLSFLYYSRGRRVAEVGYTFSERQFGSTKLSAVVVLDYLLTLYELRLGRWLPLRFAMYSAVGLSGVVVNQAGLAGAKLLVGLPNPQALMVGIELSILSNFFLNNSWTFRGRALKGLRAILRGILSFNLVCLAGALINYSVALWSVSRLGLNIFTANLIGIALATAWNYLLNVNTTWRKSGTPRG